MTDAPNTDDPDAVGDDAIDSSNATEIGADSMEPQKYQYSLIKRNKYFKNAHNTKKPI